MFGIGLPELIVILAVALIVVGPERLPGLAKSIAKQVFELKKAAAGLKESLTEELDDLPSIRPDEFTPEKLAAKALADLDDRPPTVTGEAADPHPSTVKEQDSAATQDNGSGPTAPSSPPQP